MSYKKCHLVDTFFIKMAFCGQKNQHFKWFLKNSPNYGCRFCLDKILKRLGKDTPKDSKMEKIRKKLEKFKEK